LKQVQGVLVEQRQVVEQENIALQTKFDEEKAQMQQEKEELVAGQLEVKEAVNIALCSMTGLEPQAEDRVEHQVEKLEEAIQQLQQRITDLELCTVPSTPQDVRDQREATARSAVRENKISFHGMQAT
jgi:uncharacterized protein YaaN involved in tellurite resistance